MQRTVAVESAYFGLIPYMLTQTDLVLTTGRQFMRFYEKTLPLKSFTVPVKFPPMRFLPVVARTRASGARTQMAARPGQRGCQGAGTEVAIAVISMARMCTMQPALMIDHQRWNTHNMTTLDGFEQLRFVSAFVGTLHGIYEHSPWIPERALSVARPFATVAALKLRACKRR